MRSDVVRLASAAAITACCTASLVSTPQAQAPKFHLDDPVAADDDRAFDAGRVARDVRGGWSDFVVNTFVPAVAREDRIAANVNTLDEAPDSSWFVNRTGQRPMAVAELRARRPITFETAMTDAGHLDDRAGQGLGRQPGFGRWTRSIRPGRSTRSSSIRAAPRKWRPAPRSSAPRSITRSAITSWTSIWWRSTAPR